MISIVAVGCGTEDRREPPPSETARLAESACQNGGGSGSEEVITIYLEDGHLRPDTVRVRAGREVEILVCNSGEEGHELQVGRQPTQSTFVDGFFDGVTITDMQGGVIAAEEPGRAPESPRTPAPPGTPHGHSQLSVFLRPGQATALSFVPPPSKRGTWQMGCFLDDHYEEGMRGVFVVE